jgi:hypothetical protein
MVVSGMANTNSKRFGVPHYTPLGRLIGQRPLLGFSAPGQDFWAVELLDFFGKRLHPSGRKENRLPAHSLHTVPDANGRWRLIPVILVRICALEVQPQ